ncbi:NAD-dependent epimerase/dehydratase family protein [Rhodococcus sp. MSC1_016]|jgi:dihydroflavonol-4-reductase|uniref:NAD-dependent epimerase/dehydratase family protein n=1 Tax=Rhodococcus sp. MSC1_016 TaxID=2909266 RepID=UPI00202FDB80|nr:SDR family NAD(P)-dependent oxidoreductase [Rhodococcus sp. MSC1_016]
MKIAVTGGTGYVGAHTTLALLADGHTVRLLVLPHDSIDAVVASAGDASARIEVVVGDVRDRTSVEQLLDGCDALLHGAGVVGTDDRREQLMWEVNAQATAAILVRAAFLGLDPIVHVASFSALFPSPDPVIGPDSPTAAGRSAYGRTKATADRVARALQDAGAPVVITYPTSVVGPGLEGTKGVTEQGWAVLLGSGVAPRFLGRLADAVDKYTAVSAGFSYEAAWLLTSATPTDDCRTRDELGLNWRPPRDALASTFA